MTRTKAAKPKAVERRFKVVLTEIIPPSDERERAVRDVLAIDVPYRMVPKLTFTILGLLSRAEPK